MSKFTTFDAPQEVAGRTPTRRATAEDFGGQTGAAVANLGKDVAKLGTVLRQRADKRSIAQADQSYMEGRAFWIEELQKRQDAAPEGAEGFTQTFKNDFSAWAEQEVNVEGLTPVAKAHLIKKLTALKGTFIGQAVGFESTSSAKMHRNVTERGLNADVNIAFDNLGMYQEGLDTGLGRIGRSGVKGTARAEMEKDFRNDIAHKAVLGEVNRDPANALAMLKYDDYWKQELTPDAFSQLTTAAERKLAVQDAKALTAQNKANVTARAALADIRQTYVGGNKPDPDRLDEAQAKINLSDDPSIKKDFSDLQAFSGTLTDMIEMSEGELASYLSQLPKLGGGDDMTELQRVTAKAGQVLLTGKQASVNTATSDLTKQMKIVLDGGSRPDKAQVVFLHQLANRAKDQSVANAAAQMVVRAQTAMNLQIGSFTMTEINDAVAGFMALANQDGSVSPMEQVQINTARDFAENMNKIMTTEGALSFYNGRTVVVPSVDMGNIQSQKKRFALAKTLKQKAGIENFQYYLPHELSQVQLRLKSMDGAERVAFFRSLKEAGGADAGKVFEEFSKKGDHRIGYVAGMATSGKPYLATLATEIETGARKIEDRGAAQVLPSSQQTTVAINKALGEALQHAPSGTREAIRASAEALFVQRGHPFDQNNYKVWKGLVYEVMDANVDKINGVMTVMPKGMDDDDFEEVIEGLSTTDLAQAAGTKTLVDNRGFVVSAAVVAQQGQFFYAGPPNRYMIRHQTTKTWIVGGDGQPAVFNLDAAIRGKR